MARSIANVATGSSRNRGVLMLAALFGVLSAALMFAFLSSRGGTDAVQDALQGSGEVQTVVVIARDIGFGTTITPDMLVEQQVPIGAVLPGAIANRDEVIGLVTTAPLYAGEQVIPAKVSTGDAQNALAFKVPEGMRALSLMVPHEAWVNAGLPQPGDRVDVLGITTLVTVDPLTGVERPDIVSGIIAQDVVVLAVSQTLVEVVATSVEPGSEGATTANGETGSFRPIDGDRTFEEAISITLALTPEEAAKVAIIDAMDDNAGQFRILTRYQADREHLGGTVTWTLDDVFIR